MGQNEGQTDRPVRNCQHLTICHQHGTPDGYTQDGCRCAPCTQANTAAKRRRRTEIAYGTYSGLVDADPVREHLTRLRTAGHSLRRIAELSGVGLGTVNALVYGEPSRSLPPSEQVLADTAARLLAVDPCTAPLLGGLRIPATGTRRRLQALACTGWSTQALAGHSSLPRRTLSRLLVAPPDANVTVQTARSVAAVYAHLRFLPPPQRAGQERATARQAAARAQADGWRAPHTWHDIDRDRPGSCDTDDKHDLQDEPDDPDDPSEGAQSAGSAGDPDAAVPLDEVAVELAMRGQKLPLTVHERSEAIARLTRHGVSAREIAERLHTSQRHVVRLRSALRDTHAA